MAIFWPEVGEPLCVWYPVCGLPSGSLDSWVSVSWCPLQTESLLPAHEGLGTSLWPCSSKLCVYQAWISLVIPREMLVGVSKAKPRGHGGCRSESSQQPVKPGTQSLASWPGTWNTALGVICPLAGSVRLLGFPNQHFSCLRVSGNCSSSFSEDSLLTLPKNQQPTSQEAIKVLQLLLFPSHPAPNEL